MDEEEILVPADPSEPIEEPIDEPGTSDPSTTEQVQETSYAVGREQLIAYLNTGTDEFPLWSPLGRRVEDSSAAYDWSTNTVRDIIGKIWGTMRKPIISQDFEYSGIDASDQAVVKIWNLSVKDQDVRKLTSQDVLIVHFYNGEENRPFAERYRACMIVVKSIGGQGGDNINLTLNVTYGGRRTIGNAYNVNGNIILLNEAEVFY